MSGDKKGEMSADSEKAFYVEVAAALTTIKEKYNENGGESLRGLMAIQAMLTALKSIHINRNIFYLSMMAIDAAAVKAMSQNHQIMVANWKKLQDLQAALAAATSTTEERSIMASINTLIGDCDFSSQTSSAPAAISMAVALNDARSIIDSMADFSAIVEATEAITGHVDPRKKAAGQLGKK